MKCYLCQSTMVFKFRKNNFDLFECTHCGLVATNLNKDYETFVKEFYEKGYYTGKPEYAAYANYKQDKPIIVKNMKKFLKKIKEYKKSGKLLDVGSAMGFFVEIALQDGYDAYGFDPSAYAVAEAKRVFNGRFQEGTIQSVVYTPKSFDVIVLFDVIEHLADPVKDLLKLSHLLKDDGVMVIATGDTESLAAKLLARRWTFYNAPQHLFFFNQKTFTTLLERSGLATTEWFTVGKWLSLRYILHLARSSGESEFAQLLYTKVLKTPIGKLPLYLPMRDNMVVIAKKIEV